MIRLALNMQHTETRLPPKSYRALQLRETLQ